MNAYERGFVDGLKEAYRLMGTDPEIIYSPGKILTTIRQFKLKHLAGDEGLTLTCDKPDPESKH